MPAPNEMIERVAKAMKAKNDEIGAEDEAIFEASWETLAMSAIAAVREPTPKMIEAGQDAPMWKPSPVTEIWQAMVGAALAEKEPVTK